MKVREHREVPDVAGSEAAADMFCRGGDREVRDSDARMAAPPLLPQLPRTTGEGLVERHPVDSREEDLGGLALRESQSLDHLDPADLRTGGAIVEPGEVFGRRRNGAKVVDQDARVEEDGQESNPASRSASASRSSSTSLSPSPK